MKSTASGRLNVIPKSNYRKLNMMPVFTLTSFRRAVALATASTAVAAMTFLSGCSSNPPVPEWQMNAYSAQERATSAYLTGKDGVEQVEFARARNEIASTGKASLVIRIELARCATRVAALAFDTCPGFERVRTDASPADVAYADYLAGHVTAAQAALLPEAQRAVATAVNEAAAGVAVAAIKDPLSRLVASGAVLRAGHASPQVLTVAVETASDQGWRRPLLAWLEAQALRADGAGDPATAEQLRRRIELVGGM